MKQIKLLDVIEGLIRYILLFGVLVFVLIPVVWMFFTSFKPPMEWTHDPPIWIPSSIYFENWTHMWKIGGSIALLNSIVIGGGSTLLSIVIGCLAAYSISRFRTGGENFLFWILSMRMLPPIVIAIPLLILYSNIHLVDTYLGLIIAHTVFNLPLVVWLMKGFFDELPKEIEEAATIDGCSVLGTLYRIVLPLSKSGIAVTALFCLIFSWNEYLFTLVLTQSKVYTLPVRLSMFFNENTGNWWGPQSALSLLAIIPIIIIGILLQRYLVRGLTLGAIKG